MTCIRIIAFLLATCACFVGSSLAAPLAVYEVPLAAAEEAPIAALTLLDVDSALLQSDDADLTRSARGLGLLSAKFGGFGSGHSFKGLGGGGFGGLGFGGLHGLGGGFGLKSLFNKPFLG